MDDVAYSNLLEYLSFGKYPLSFKSLDCAKRKTEKRSLRVKAKVFSVKDGVLIKNNCRVLRENEISSVLTSLHSGKYAGGHLGRDKTYQKCIKGYYWKGMKDDVTAFVRDCDMCSRVNFGPLKTGPPLNSIPVPSRVWSLVGIDIVGPLPITDNGNKYIVAATDHFSKWTEAKGIPNKSAEEVTKFLLDIICRLGPMDSIITDQGKEFTNKLIDSLTDELDIDHRISSAYHPQTNGQRERDNRTMKEMLTKVVNEDGTNWDVLLPSTLFAYRSSVHSSTKVTPFEVMYGREAKLISSVNINNQCNEFSQDVLRNITTQREFLGERVARNIEMAQARQKRNFDIRNKAFEAFPKGSKVLMKNASKIRRFGAKLKPRWVGPYVVSDVLTKGRVRLVNDRTGKILANVYHSSFLKLYTCKTKEDGKKATMKRTSTKKQLKSLPTRKIKRTAKLTKRYPIKKTSAKKETPCPRVRSTRKTLKKPLRYLPTRCFKGKTKLPTSSSAKVEVKVKSVFSPPTADQCKVMCADIKVPYVKRPSYCQEKQASVPLKLKQIQGDGNCLFRAISFAISGSENSHGKCRQKIVNHMRSAKVSTKLTNYMNKNIDHYLEDSNMEANTVWATDAEIMGAASLLNKDIYVYGVSGANAQGGQHYDWLRYPASFSLDTNTKGGLYLQNIANDHFNVVLSC